jgi:F-type H+-transporting ATPase subunit epsilon
MATMHVELVSPERVVFSGESTMVVTRTLGGGEIAFQPGHAPFLAALTENHTRIYLVDGSVQDVAVHAGFVEVAGNKVSLLCDVAELSQDIDRARAERARGVAEESLLREHNGEVEAALRRAHARLNAAGGLSGGGVRPASTSSH